MKSDFSERFHVLCEEDVAGNTLYFTILALTHPHYSRLLPKGHFDMMSRRTIYIHIYSCLRHNDALTRVIRDYSGSKYPYKWKSQINRNILFFLLENDRWEQRFSLYIRQNILQKNTEKCALTTKIIWCIRFFSSNILFGNFKWWCEV